MTKVKELLAELAKQDPEDELFRFDTNDNFWYGAGTAYSRRYKKLRSANDVCRGIGIAAEKQLI